MMLNQFLYRNILLIATFTPLLLVIFEFAAVETREVTVRVDRWLAVRQNQGQVTYQQPGSSRLAKNGDRLQTVGDGVI